MRLKLPPLNNSEWSVALNEDERTLDLRLSTKVNGEYLHVEHRIDRFALAYGYECMARGIVENIVRRQERAIGAAVLGRPLN